MKTAGHHGGFWRGLTIELEADYFKKIDVDSAIGSFEDSVLTAKYSLGCDVPRLICSRFHKPNVWNPQL